MRTLAIETAMAVCSVALIEDGMVVAAEHAAIARGHAERLLPMIATLPDGGRCDAILVDIGPGSFTGIRVGIAAARALAFAWGVPVHGFASLALLATADGGRDDTMVAIEGGHGELFIGRYAGNPLAELEPPVSLPFERALDRLAGFRVIGNVAARLAAAGHGAGVAEIAPDARDVAKLPPALCTLGPVPFYGRGADAKPMAPA